MREFCSLTNHFLIAMPALMDPNFYRSVTYIFEHNMDGAMGIVVNHPLDIELGEVFSQMNLASGDPDIVKRTVYLGGPVQTERGFVLHRPLGNWESTLSITAEIGITTSRDIVTAVANGDGPGQCFIALGYAGWGAGQLEQEISNNSWLSGPANLDVVFNTPVQTRWESAAALLGVDINTLSTEIGHA